MHVDDIHALAERCDLIRCANCIDDQQAPTIQFLARAQRRATDPCASLSTVEFLADLLQNPPVTSASQSHEQISGAENLCLICG